MINFPTGYFFVCLILPIGLALVVWCVYFLPIGILSFIHFTKGEMWYEKRWGEILHVDTQP